MEIFIHAILLKSDGEALIKQLQAAEEAGIGRVGVFVKSVIGYNSASYEIREAVKIINEHIRYMD